MKRFIDNDDARLMELGVTNDVPFKVPEGYFESLPQRIMARIPEAECKVVELKPRKRNVIKYWIGVGVAASLLIGIVGVTHYRKHNVKTFNFGLSTDDQYVAEYLDYGLVDTDDVYCYLNGDEF